MIQFGTLLLTDPSWKSLHFLVLVLLWIYNFRFSTDIDLHKLPIHGHLYFTRIYPPVAVLLLHPNAGASM